MEVVQPVRDPAMVVAMGEALERLGSSRDRFLWELGTNTSYRIGDLLSLRVRDVWVAGIGQARTHLAIRAEKTGKKVMVALNPDIRAAIVDYCAGLQPGRYLFPSRKGSNTPIGRKQAWRIVRAGGRELGLENIGTHTMRKTFGYHMYRKEKNVALIQRFMGHKKPDTTLRYIGVEQDEMDAAATGLSYRTPD